MQQPLGRLCDRLNYQFKKTAYLKQALTHCSASQINNERFEFLGDSILSAVIAHALFEKYPQQPEGQLSRLRAYLVRGEMLAEIATKIDLGHYLYLGQGELKSGGFRRASILADALEAIFAAIFIDSGFEAARDIILKLYHDLLNDPNLQDNLKDYKTQLQEVLQAKKIQLPKYALKEIVGEEHEQIFCVTCSVEELKLITEGQAETRRKAEQLAAKRLLIQLDGTR